MKYTRAVLFMLSLFSSTYAVTLDIVRLFVPQDSIVYKDGFFHGVIELELAAQIDSILVGIQLSSNSGTQWETPLLSDFFFTCKPGLQRLKFKVSGNQGPHCVIRATAFDTLPVVDGMRLIPAEDRCFYMGSQTESSAERPRHPVCLTYDFLMDTTKLAIPAFQQFKPDYLPAFLGRYYYETGAAVDNVFWHQAILFCNKKSIEHGLDTCYGGFDSSAGSHRNFFNVKCDYSKNGYRLPSEAEWEFACRAGSAGRFFWGDDSSLIDKYVWFQGTFDDTIHAVAKKAPNRFGLYDMNGSALEMANDWYDSTYYAVSPRVNPIGPENPPAGDPDPCRAVRGGHAISAGKYISSSKRMYNFSSASHMNSFRCVRTVTNVGPGKSLR